jgi:hypothetical protein
MAAVDDTTGNLRKRKSNTALNGNANGHANGEAKVANGQSWITEHGREVDRKLDMHHE